ncbi:hypothetical protein PPL_03050 [Heterostelium album PN500]|uniref:UspA domain-containing protein n=1 Tax=Heterostelium pallidum (strain ATCC 26659 / Pp 5 / PN500) TaxID=670386 RepID=D3B3S9_HETP5|nr:hypothetical protein PPL_03050 [Heterostelium album PN500]EFA83977.1 hypothetical protein PPL_03050 [Heterostelium album PN500]|eukprot:XP_020436094.1 hypothetical protein PPL_03050 [Heterostelium album PN500]
MVYKYLVCLDGSEVSYRAYSWAHSQAMADELRNTHIYLLNIVDKMKIERKEISIKGVEEFVKDLEAYKIPFEAIVLETTHNLKQTICEVAEKNNVDMIIIGHDDEHKRRLHRIFDGHSDVYEYVIKHSQCAVLVFK